MTEPREKNPYVGPRAFVTGEELYGRERETRELLDLLIAERIVLLHSPSGAGKSSLIQAKLIPALRDERFQVLPIIRVNEPPPPNAPLETFNRYVFSALRCLESDVPADQSLPLEALFEMRLPDYLDRRLSSGADKPASTVLIFDQFEEIVSLDPTDQSAKMDFFAQVGQALRDRRRWALFALRGDYKAAIESYTRPIPTRLENAFGLDLLGSDAAHEAIQQPARRAGVDFIDSAVQQLVDDLRTMHVQQMDGSFEERPGPNVEPVQLQVVCLRLWQHLPPDAAQITEADIEAVGEVDDALAGYYSDVVQAVSEKTGVRKRLIRAWFEDQLITQQGMRSQVLLQHEYSGGLDNRAIELLRDAYLVRADKRSGSTWYELAHDRLIKPIRENNAEWFKTNLSPLQQQAELWRRADYPDSLLLRDAALDEAVQWAGEHDADLMPDERKLLKLSLEAREQEQERARLVQQQLEAARQLAEAERQRAEEQAQVAQRMRARNRVIASLAIAAVLLLVLAVAAFFDARNQTQIARQQEQKAVQAQETAEASTKREEEAKKQTEVLLKEQQRKAAAEQRRADSVQLANYAARETQPDKALLLSLEALRVTETVEAKTSLLDGLMRNSHLITLLSGPSSAINSVAFSPDGKTVAAAGWDGLYFWDATTERPLSKTIETIYIVGIAFSPDGRQLAVKDDSGGMTLWEWATGKPRTIAGPAPDLGQRLDQGNLVVFSPDGQLLATSGQDYIYGGSAIFVWDLASGQLLSPTLTYSPTYVSRLAFDPDSKILAAGYDDGAIVLWDVASGQPLSPTLRMGTSSENFSVTSLKFIQSDSTPASWLLAVDAQGRIAEIYRDNDSDTWRMDYQTETDLNNTNASINSPTYPYNIAFWNGDNMQITLRVGDTSSPGESLSGHTRQVTSSAFSLDGSQLVTADETGRVILWRTSGNALSSLLPQRHTWPVIGAAFSGDGNTLVSVDDNNRIIVWNTAGQMPTVTVVISPEVSAYTTVYTTAMALSPNGKTLALGADNGAVALWDLDQRQKITEVISHTSRVTGLAFSPNGREFVSVGADRNYVMWDANGRPRSKQVLPIGSRSANTSTVPSAVAFSPKGIIVVGYEDGSVAFLDPTSPDGNALKKPHKGAVTKIAFNSIGNLATGSRTEIQLWSNASLTPTLIGSITGDVAGDLTSLAFGTNNDLLLGGTSSGAIVVWDISDALHPKLLTSLTGHTRSVTALAFSPQPGAQSLISGGEDATLRLWSMAPDKWTAAACQAAARNLTWQEWDTYFPKEPYHEAATCGQFPVDLKEIATGYLVRAEQDSEVEDIASSQWFTRSWELINRTQDFYAAQPICSYSLSHKMAIGSQLFCQRAVELSLRADKYDPTFSICQLGISNNLSDVVRPACTRARELSLAADDYSQLISFCRFGTLHDQREIALPACARAIELGTKSKDDYYQLYNACELGSLVGLNEVASTACTRARELSLAADDYNQLASFCRFGALHDLREIALPACTRAIELSMKSKDDYYQLYGACELGALARLDTAASCTRAVELSVKSEDYYQMFDMCALGSFFKLKVDFTIACDGAAKQVGSLRFEAYLSALAGQIDRAKSLFEKAVQEAQSSDDATANNNVCWSGGLTGLPEIAQIVKPACERGVNLGTEEDKPIRRDSRGLVRALLGDMPDAIADFQSMVEWLESEKAALQYDPATIMLYTTERKSFIEALKAGKNPFDGKTLYLLRYE